MKATKEQHSCRDVVISIEHYSVKDDETKGHICTYQINKKYLRKIKKLLKESFEKENFF